MRRTVNKAIEYKGDSVKIDIETFPTGRSKELMGEISKLAYNFGKPFLSSLMTEFKESMKSAKSEGKKLSLLDFDLASLDLTAINFTDFFESLINLFIDDDNDTLVKKLILNCGIKFPDKNMVYFKSAESGEFDEDVYDDIFSGDLSLIFIMIKHVLEVNYADFLELLGKGMKKEAVKDKISNLNPLIQKKKIA